jgi:hypothetical protein
MRLGERLQDLPGQIRGGQVTVGRVGHDERLQNLREATNTSSRHS